MNLFYSVEIDFMKSLSLPVLEPKSSLFYRGTHGHSKVCPKKAVSPSYTLKKLEECYLVALKSHLIQDDQMSLGSWAFSDPLPKDFPKVRPKKTASPLDTMKNWRDAI